METLLLGAITLTATNFLLALFIYQDVREFRLTLETLIDRLETPDDQNPAS